MPDESQDWDRINREISGSIEPKPAKDAILHERKISPKKAWAFTTAGWMDDAGAWEPRNWREPAAAMELLRKLCHTGTVEIQGFSDRVRMFADLKTVEARGHGSTTEEAIVLGYYAMIRAEKAAHA